VKENLLKAAGRFWGRLTTLVEMAAIGTAFVAIGCGHGSGSHHEAELELILPQAERKFAGHWVLGDSARKMTP